MRFVCDARSAGSVANAVRSAAYAAESAGYVAMSRVLLELLKAAPVCWPNTTVRWRAE